MTKDIVLIADRINSNLCALFRLNGLHGTEAARVLNLGIPLADMILSGHIDSLTEEGMDNLNETDETLRKWINTLTAFPNTSIAEWWNISGSVKL